MERLETFSNEKDLPRLPLPSLQDSLGRLVKGLEPLRKADGNYQYPLDGGRIVEFTEGIEEFLGSTVAEKLQKKLEEIGKEENKKLDSFYFDFNEQLAEKKIASDILPRNPFLLLADDATEGISQEGRAGVLCYSALRFVSALRRNMLSPDFTNDGKPKSMAAYLNLFCTTRAPVFKSGEVESVDLSSPFSESDVNLAAGIPDSGGDITLSVRGIRAKNYPSGRHILIISKGQYYTLDVLGEDSELLYNGHELSQIFGSVLQDSTRWHSSNRYTALGSLTSCSFRSWKYARKRLQKRFPYEQECIDSAIFVIVLDESTGATEQDGSSPKRFYYGTSVIDELTGSQVGSCISRWYDKLQLVITADAKACVIWDSFTCDGSAILRFASDIYAESVLRLAREVNNRDTYFSLWPKVQVRRILHVTDAPDKFLRKIEWSFSDILNTHIHLSETKLTDIISKHDVVHHSIPFGRRTALRFGVRPDSMIQIALQLAHYALYGRMSFSVEPISIRCFKDSKSSYMPVHNNDLLELCQQFISNSLTELEKFERFAEACSCHSLSILETQAGMAIDKHFNCLQFLFKSREHFGIKLSDEEEKCASKLFDNLDMFFFPELIASNCGNTAMELFGVTPAIDQGFGIGYIIKPDQCDITVISQHRQGRRLLFMLEWVLTEMNEYWKLTRESNGGEGVIISPTVDMLYEIDNALNIARDPPQAVETIPDTVGYGLFDLKGHKESRSSTCSSPVRKSTSQLKISDLLTSLSLKQTNNMLAEVQNSRSISEELYKYSSQHDNNIEEDVDLIKKRKNVIYSKFDINFDRSRIGRKISTVD